jgi:hypothetical protein
MDWGWPVMLILITPFISHYTGVVFAGLLWGLLAVIRDSLRERMAAKRASETRAEEALAINNSV